MDILGHPGSQLREFRPARQQFEQQSSQVICLSANIHFTQKVDKYMQNGQLLQLKGGLQEHLSYLTSFQFDQDLLQVKLKALFLDLIHKIAVMDDLLNHKSPS